jgi:hypothetical protein
MRKFLSVALVLLVFATLFAGFASAEDPWGPRIVRPEYDYSLLGWLSERWQSFLGYF